MIPRFILLIGPSGSGRSTLIRQLCTDSRYQYISPYMTRNLREGERDKRAVSEKEMDGLEASQSLITVNRIYGVRYGTPKEPILQAFKNNQFPILDWPSEKIDLMIDVFTRRRLFIVYVAPPSLNELYRRLSLDRRDCDGERFRVGSADYAQYLRGAYDTIADIKIISYTDQVLQCARQIHERYLTTCKHPTSS